MKLASNCTTDVELATVLGIDKGLFASWKNVRKEIPTDALIEFCDKYNLTLDYLLRDKENDTEYDAVSIPYFKDYDFTNKSENIHIPRACFKDHGLKDVKAIFSLTQEMPVSMPKGSISFFDFAYTEVRATPNTFLIEAHGNYFIREVAITPQNDYFLGSENTHIEATRAAYDEINILAKFKGVLKWQK